MASTKGYERLENRIYRATAKMNAGFIAYYYGQVKVSETVNYRICNCSPYIIFNGGRPDRKEILEFLAITEQRGLTAEWAEKTKVVLN